MKSNTLLINLDGFIGKGNLQGFCSKCNGITTFLEQKQHALYEMKNYIFSSETYQCKTKEDLKNLLNKRQRIKIGRIHENGELIQEKSLVEDHFSCSCCGNKTKQIVMDNSSFITDVYYINNEEELSVKAVGRRYEFQIKHKVKYDESRHGRKTRKDNNKYVTFTISYKDFMKFKKHTTYPYEYEVVSHLVLNHIIYKKNENKILYRNENRIFDISQAFHIELLKHIPHYYQFLFFKELFPSIEEERLVKNIVNKHEAEGFAKKIRLKFSKIHQILGHDFDVKTLTKYQKTKMLKQNTAYKMYKAVVPNLPKSAMSYISLFVERTYNKCTMSDDLNIYGQNQKANPNNPWVTQVISVDVLFLILQMLNDKNIIRDYLKELHEEKCFMEINAPILTNKTIKYLNKYLPDMNKEVQKVLQKKRLSVKNSEDFSVIQYLREYFLDTFKMLTSLNDLYENFLEKKIKEEEKLAVLKKWDEFHKTKHKNIVLLHDNLADLTTALTTTNYIFEYNETVMNHFTRNIDEYRFYLPKNNLDLKTIGQKMHHCVAGYGKFINDGNKYVIAVQNKKGEFVLCLEISNKFELRQAKLKYNKTITENDTELKMVMKKYLELVQIPVSTKDVKNVDYQLNPSVEWLINEIEKSKPKDKKEKTSNIHPVFEPIGLYA